MRYATANAFRHALGDRLKHRAREDDVDVNRLRKLVTFDRLLARLISIDPDGWVLKGALALELRYPGEFRSTRDADLGHWGTTDLNMHAVPLMDLGDYFSFSVESTSALDKLVDAVAIRYRVTAQLAGRRFETVTIDVGYGEPPYLRPTVLDGPDLLTFAEIEQLKIPALSLEQHVAEKLHAYTRIYEGGRRSSRAKDLVDLVMIQRNSWFLMGQLRIAINKTFNNREVQPLPETLPSPPHEWRQMYRDLAGQIGVTEDLAEGFHLASNFLNPVLSGALLDDAQWKPDTGSWHSPNA